MSGQSVAKERRVASVGEGPLGFIVHSLQCGSGTASVFSLIFPFPFQFSGRDTAS